MINRHKTDDLPTSALPRQSWAWLFFVCVSIAGWMIWEYHEHTLTSAILVTIILLLAWLQALLIIRLQQTTRRQLRLLQILSRNWRTDTALQSLGYFSAAVLHNIANPLSYLNSILADMGKQMSRQQRRDVEACLSYVCAVVRHSQHHLQAIPPTKETIEVEKLISGVGAVVRSLVTYKGIRMKFECPTKLTIKGDAIFLQQIILNLVQNSIESMSRVGSEIIVSAQKKNESILIRIEDNGPGMPPEQLDQIGKRFFTVKPGHTGLGTSFVRETMEKYFNGSCHYQSKLGQGTTVTLVFPVQ